MLFQGGPCLPLAVSSAKLGSAGSGPENLPPENLLSGMGQMASACVLCKFRSETYKPL